MLLAKLGSLEEAAPNSSAQKFIVERLKAVRVGIADLQGKGASLNAQILQMHMDLASKAVHAAMDFENLGTKAVVAMRSELEFPINAEQYEATLRAVREKTRRRNLFSVKCFSI